MQSETVPGIRYERVARFFREHVPGADGPLHFELLSGGRSNLTYRVTCGERVWVLRRPPLGHVLPTAHDMVREYRVLTALNETDVPAPRAIALCDDPEVNDHPFYVMTFVDGVIIGDSIPEGYADTVERRRALSFALVDALARLHSVDYEALGLADFGRPEGYLERQVRRWSEQWARSQTRPLPAIDELIRRLRASIPVSPKPTIVHGDYRLGNMMLDREDPGRVVAVLDWEMATLGDPLTDVGYTLGYWGQVGDSEEYLAARAASAVTAQPGFHTRQELIEMYARLSGRDVSAIEWYEIFAAYKLAVIVEGIHARYLKGETVGEGFEGMGKRAEMLVEEALAMADRATDPRLRGAA